MKIVLALFAAISFSVQPALSQDKPHWEELREAGAAAYARGDYRQSLKDFVASRQEAESAGAQPEELASIWGELGAACQAMGRYAEAEAFDRQALEVRERTFGPNSREAAVVLNNLAAVLLQEANPQDAEPLARRAIVILEKQTGNEREPEKKGDQNLTLLKALSNLGAIYRAEQRIPDAESVYERALAASKQIPNHPAVGTLLNNLAQLRSGQGDYSKAEALARRALQIAEQTSGSESEKAADAGATLAGIKSAQDDFTAAEPLLRRALAVHEKTLGPSHPQIAVDLGNLGLATHKSGHDKEAEKLYQRALVINRQALGSRHSQLAVNLNNLAQVERKLGRSKEAEDLYRQALAIWEGTLGPDHPNVASALTNLASLYQAQHKYDEAEPLYRRALAINEKRLGPGRPETAYSARNLAVLYAVQKRYGEALPYYWRAIPVLQTIESPDDPQLLQLLKEFATVLRANHNYAEAEQWEVRATRIEVRAALKRP